MMRKILCVLLVLCLALPLGLGEELFLEDDELFFDDEELDLDDVLTADPGPEYDYTALTVGSTTKMSGNFATSFFGTNTSDLDAQALLQGYQLVQWNATEGRFETDSRVVSGIAVTQDAEGNKTFIFVLNEDLVYSDGSPITAQDYVFSILLSASPELAQIGGITTGSTILGAADYMSGNTKKLQGVSLLDTYQFSVTIDGSYLPFFYELGLFCYTPYPISVLAPGCTVRDESDGAYIDGLTASILETSLLGDAGYQRNPTVTSGPYTLESFDGQTAVFVKNPYYTANFQGKTPLLQTITYTLADNADMIEKLAAGEFGLLNKVTNYTAISEGMAQVAKGYDNSSFYMRSGAAFIHFCCEQTAVSGDTVRRAISMCLDKDALVTEYLTDSYGFRVDGYYGVGQWMYMALNGLMTVAEDEEEQAAWDALSMDTITRYDLDPTEAAALLQADGWVLNEEGIRQKEIDGELVTLDLTLLYPEGNAIGGLLEAYFVPNLQQAGIRLTLQPMEYTELLQHYYRQTERTADMIFIATNFDLLFDPAASFDPDDAQTGRTNRTAIEDEELYNLALEMNRTEPEDTIGYVQKWLEFQQRFQEVVPSIGVYSNIYFDFYTAHLTDYDITANVSWAQAIVGAYMNDIADGAGGLLDDETGLEDEELELW